MKMKKGYERVSSTDQNLERQTKALKKAGCKIIYSEKISGANMERPELQRMLQELQRGDEIVIMDLTRFSRSTRDLFNLLDQVHEKGASLKSIKDSWLDTSSSNPMSKFLLTVMAALAELERDQIRERQKEGIAIAKQKGVYKGRLKKYSDKHPGMQHAIELALQRDKTVKEICEITKVSRSALYRELKNLETK
jgi:DNA invertase Pin-like site-specific DNA recombinase